MRDQDDYGVMARDYLARARERLMEGSKAALFHAALELRCCVEARQAEYLEGQLKPGKKLQPYRLGENAKTIQKIFAGELIFEMATSTDAGVPVATHYHTPVPKALLLFCEKKIDALRHAQTSYRPPSDAWWNATRDELIKHYRMAWVACQGLITMPPLWDRRTGMLSTIRMQLAPGQTGPEAIRLYPKDLQFRLRVAYLEAPPPEWKCDL